MAEILGGSMGPETTYDISFVGGALVVAVAYQGVQAGASMSLNVSATQLLTALDAHATNSMEKLAIETVLAIISRIP